MKIINCSQGSAEWLMERAGRITASRIADVMATLKRGGESAARATYRIELVAERLTGMTADHFVTPEMQWGKDNETLARATYEIGKDTEVDQIGFAIHSAMDFAGASPDGLVGSDGCIEIKCPKTKTHLEWLLAGVVPPEHEPQMSFVMGCCERKWCDFISFDPRLPEPLQFFCVRLERDEARITEIDQAVSQFNAEIDATIERLKAICGRDFILPKPITKKPPKSEDAPESYLTDADFVGLL